jgi:hypothetical protein
MRKKEKKRGSIQSAKDIGIALGTVVVALVVILMITTPVLQRFPVATAGSIDYCSGCSGSSGIVNSFTGRDCCEEIELPSGSMIWVCQYIAYWQENETISINLNKEESWEEHGDLIFNLTELESKEKWEILCAEMFSRDEHAEEYLLDQGFYVISCSDCDCFWLLVDMANNCECPLRIAMYDCCCVICPIIPIFIY